MFGWLSFPASEASLRKSFSKRLASSSPMSMSRLATLIAILRSLNGSSPRKTTAEAPCPSSDRMLYLPIFRGRSGTFARESDAMRCLRGSLTDIALEAAGEGEEAVARNVGHLHDARVVGARIVAEKRFAIRRVVVVHEQIRDERAPVAASELLLPVADPFRAVEVAQAIELRGERAGIGHEMRIVLEQQRDARRFAGFETDARRGAHARDERV